MSAYSIGMWENIRIVGKGGSSTVYKAVMKSDHTKFIAVKQIETDGFFAEQINNIKLEIATIRDLNHPNIISYLGTEQSENKIYILLEYADRGSLRQYYQRKGALRETQAASCIGQILAGLEYLHNKGIAHRDIKCANCLLTASRECKLADFGASKNFLHDSIISGLKGTPNWMSPEVIKGTQMTTGWLKADVWSLGCTVVEMVSGTLPYSYYDNPMTAMYHIANGEVPSFRDLTVSDALKAFVIACCATDPTARPTATELMTFDFVAPFTETYRSAAVTAGRATVVTAAAAAVPMEDVVEMTKNQESEKAPEERSPNVGDGIVLSIDLFTALDDSTGSRADAKAVKIQTEPLKHFTTLCVEDPLLMSSSSSTCGSPRKRQPSITDDSADTVAVMLMQQKKMQDASTPLTTARKGLYNSSESIPRSRSRTHRQTPPPNPVKAQGRAEGAVNVGTSSSSGVKREASSSSSNTARKKDSPTSPAQQSRIAPTQKEKTSAHSSARVKSSHGSLSGSPKRHMSRTNSKTDVRTNTSTPSNSARRAPNVNGPLVVKTVQAESTEIKEEPPPVEAKAVPSIPNFQSTSVVTPFYSSTSASVSMADDEASIELYDQLLKSYDDSQALDSYSQDQLLNESDVLANMDRPSMKDIATSEVDDNSNGMKVMSRCNSRGGALAGRPPMSPSPHSPPVPSMSCMSPHTFSKKQLEPPPERGLRRVSSMTQDELRLLESSNNRGARKISRKRSGHKEIPVTTAPESLPTRFERRDRSDSDLMEIDVRQHMKATVVDNRRKTEDMVGCGRPNAPLSGEIRRLGDSGSQDVLGPLGLFDTFPSAIPVPKPANSHNGSGTERHSSGSIPNHSTRLESGSAKMERLSQSGAASVRANALRESEALASGSGSGGSSSKASRLKASKKKVYHLNFDGLSNALKSFNGNIQSNADSEFTCSSNASFRSQSAGMLPTTHSLGIGLGIEPLPHQDSLQHPTGSGFLDAYGPPPNGSNAERTSNLTPGISGLYPITLGVNISQHLLPAMNMILPLQKRIIQSAPALSRSVDLPPLQSGGSNVPRSEAEDKIHKKVVNLYDKINSELKMTGSNSEGNSMRKLKDGKFPRRLHSNKSFSHFSNIDNDGCPNEYQP